MTVTKSSSSSSRMPVVFQAPHNAASAPASKPSVALEKKRIEVCGRGFFTEMEEAKVIVEDEVESERADDSPSGNQKGDRNKPKSFTKAGIFKVDDNLKGVDLYKFMQIPEDATEKDIKKAFQKMCLVYHPDKAENQAKGADAANKEFIKLQEAYDILMDPVTRRKFDSSRPFDDSIPKEKDCASLPTEDQKLYDEEFFYLFADVFKRNAKWSLKQPVPSLPGFFIVDGKNADAKPTPWHEVTDEESEDYKKYMAKVTDFYKFWTGSFESWRDFDQKILDEEGDDALEDPTKTEYREEKRFIERKNARIRQKYRNDESKRLLDLAELAEKYDSRIKRVKEQQWARKNAGKEAKRKEKEEKEKREQEEREAREKAEKEAEEARLKEKEAKENEKNALKVLRRDLRALAKQHAKTVSAEQFQEMLLAVKGKDDTDALLTALSDELAKKQGDLESGEALVSKISALIREHLSQEPIMVKPPVDEPVANNTAAFQESAPAKKAGNNKKKKGGNKSGKAAPEDDVDERAENAERQLDMEAESKRQHEAEKKRKQAAEKRKQEEAQRKKMEDAAKKKEQEKERKAQEKEKKEKEAAKQQAEEQRKKHQEESAREKKEAEQQKLAEIHSEQYTKQRDEQLSQFDNAGKSLEALLAEVKAELPADAFKEAWIRALTKKQEQPAAKKLEKKPSSASEEEDVDSPEARTEAAVDIAACLAANFSKYKFFEIAVRVDHAHLTVPSSIRNKVKKLRENLRKAIRAELPPAHQKPDAKESKKFSSGEMEKVLNGALPEQDWQIVKPKGEGNAQGAGAKSKKKKPAKKEEEDLDAIFAEMGIEEGKKGKKGKK